MEERIMAAPRNPVDVRRAVGLSAVESAALAYCAQAAAEGRQVTRADLCKVIGSDNFDGGTGPGILKRLEAKGYITRKVFQRGVQVCVDGKCSLPPRDTSIHWRNRTDRTASPSLTSMREREPSLMKWAEAYARQIGMGVPELLERAASAELARIRNEEDL